MIRAHYSQAVTLLRRTRQIQKICDELEALLARLGLPPRGVLALADAAIGHRVRNATYRNIADVTEAVASRDLRALVEAGLLDPKGEKRGRFYQASDRVAEIRRRVAEPKTIVDPFELVNR